MDKEHLEVHIDAELEELIPNYLSNRLKDVSLIREAVETDDMEKARILGHSMKGSGGGYGFDRISQIGSEIEEAAKRGDSSSVLKQLDDLSDYLDRVEVVYVEE